MTQKTISTDRYPSVHYNQVKEICYLKDIKRSFSNQETQCFNSDRDTFSSIAEKLYKKIVKQGYIEKAEEFAIPQTKKKVENMYDLSDKWINDEEAFTESQTQKTALSQFSQYKAISGMSIEEFYDSKFKKSPFKSPAKNDKPRVVNNKLSVSQLLRNNQLTVVKYDELKKKIQWSLRNTSPYKPIQK